MLNVMNQDFEEIPILNREKFYLKNKIIDNLLVEFDDLTVVCRYVSVRVHHEDYCVIQLIEIQLWI